MTQVTVVENNVPSVISDMAQRFGMDKRAFEATLKATVVPANVSNEQFAAFLLVAKQYNLNPITKEIYAFPAKGGGIQPIVGIDGWCNIINSNPHLDGIEFEDILTDGKITAIKCRIYRKDRAKPTEAVEYMDECKKASEPWNKWPARMLRHKALIQCARYAFGYSGIVDPDEGERLAEISEQPASMGPTTGSITPRQAYGSSKAMKLKYNEIVTAITKCVTAKAIEEVKATYAADYETFKSIDTQLHYSLGEIEFQRRNAIEMAITKIQDIAPKDDDEEQDAFESEMYERQQALSEPPAFLQAGPK